MAIYLPIRGASHGVQLKVVGVNKFIVLVVIDHKDMLICFPFDRGRMDCYFFIQPPLPSSSCCLSMSRLINQKFHRFRVLELIGNLSCVALWKFRSLLPYLHLEKEWWLCMWVVDAINLYFGLVIGLATYKTHMFEEDDLTVTSSILLHVGLVKFFIPIIKFDSCEGVLPSFRWWSE